LARVVDGDVHYFAGGKDVGIFVTNFAVVASDGTQRQTGVAVLNSAELAVVLKTTPGEMPLPYSFDKSSGDVTLNYDADGFLGAGSGAPFRAVLHIPGTTTICEFDPQNNGVVADPTGSQTKALRYFVYSLDGKAVASSLLGRVYIVGTGDATITSTDTVIEREHVALGTPLLTGVSGESGIQLSSRPATETGIPWSKVDPGLFARMSDGTYLAVMANPQ